MADLWIGSVNNWTFSRSESTSEAKLLWPMLSWVQGNSSLFIWCRRMNVFRVRGATCIRSRVRCLIARCWNQRHRSPELESHSIVSGNIYCRPGAGPSVCRLCSWCLAVVYVELFKDRQVRRRHHRLATCLSEGSRSSSSEVQQRREEPLNLLYYFLGVKTRWY